MKELVFYFLVTGLVLISAIVFFVIFLFKRNRTFGLLTIICLLFGLSLGSYSVYLVASKSLDKVCQNLKPRTGEQVYKGLFGENTSTCLKVVNYQDQVVPRLDVAIWLQAETCPAECNRILSEFNYGGGELITSGIETRDIPLADYVNWFNPYSMGDTILVFEHEFGYRTNIRTLWISKDSTIMYCRDILD